MSEQKTVSGNDIRILTIPAASQEDADLQAAAARDWVNAAALEMKSTHQMMTLQGARVFWTTGRIAVLAQSDRLDTVRSALIEASWYEPIFAASNARWTRPGRNWKRHPAGVCVWCEIDCQSTAIAAAVSTGCADSRTTRTAWSSHPLPASSSSDTGQSDRGAVSRTNPNASPP